MTLTNVYLIDNQNELKCTYKLYRIRGLDSTSEEYDKNAQILSDKLSRITKSPCESIKENGDLYIAQPIGSTEPPEKFTVIRGEALIEPTDIERELDFGNLKDEDIKLAIRFLKFYLDGPLHNNLYLWRPGAGRAFYQKVPDEAFSFFSHDAEAYKGFQFRPVVLPDNRIGVCVDLSMTYAAKHTLPVKISPDEFRKFKGKNCIYEYGRRWYVIRIEGLNDLKVNELELPDKGGSLFDHLHTIAKSDKPKTLQMLPKDGSVITYKTSTGQIRNVPSGLCRLVFNTSHPAVKKYHRKSIMPPHIKKKEIDFAVRKYLTSLSFQGMPIKLSDDMLDVKTEKFMPPDLKFGNNKILSVKGTDGTIKTPLEEFGHAKTRLLFSENEGFFLQKPLDKQYIILPKTMMTKFGDSYVSDIKEQFRRLYSPKGEFEYNPSVISYDDTIAQRSIYSFGKQIIDTAEINCTEPGYALVIIPRLRPNRGNKEDELANLVMRELRKREVYASVAHTETPSKNYVPMITNEGHTQWQKTSDTKQQRRFKNYLSNVVLNKILLLNSCWPFVLSNHLHADLTIGIDVKNNTAGFTLIFKDGQTISFHSSPSDQKEQLSRNHLSKKLYEILSEELEEEELQIKNIVIQRDGRIFQPEITGIQDALNRLATDSLIDENFDCNIVEVRKTSLTPIRFFEAESLGGSFKERIENPTIGTYKIFQNNAFLCNTGRPFRHPGTTKPLQIIKIQGSMDFSLILEDLFDLANLTWTKVDDCSRDPITIKMTDIRLREVAGGYNKDNFEFFEDELDE